LQGTNITTAASTKVVMGLKLVSNEHCTNLNFFNLVLLCALNLATLKRLVAYKFARKISIQDRSFENVGRFDFRHKIAVA